MLATTQDKQKATDKLYEFIRTGTQSAERVINHVLENQPTDELPRGGSLKFEGLLNKDEIAIQYPARGGEVVTRTLHRHAIGQMAQTIDMPVKFLDSLQETRAPWGRELLAHNLETIFYERHASKRFLTRSINGQVRGFLSDQYRRIDSRPLVEAFAEEVMAKGARPYEGVVTDTKIAIKAIYPEVYEPVPLLKGNRTATVEEFDNDGETTNTHTLTAAKVRQGIERMAAKYPHHMKNLLEDNADCETGDVLVQLALLGEIVYG